MSNGKKWTEWSGGHDGRMLGTGFLVAMKGLMSKEAKTQGFSLMI
jgi:hypothetical protein